MQVRWELVAGFFVAGLLTVASVIVFAALVARRVRASWKFWLYGAIVFVVFQGVLRLPWTVALNFLFREALRFRCRLFHAPIAHSSEKPLGNRHGLAGDRSGYYGLLGSLGIHRLEIRLASRENSNVKG